MGRKLCLLRALHHFVPFPPLMQNNINDLVLFGYIFCRVRHQLVDNLAEQIDVALRIVANASCKLCDSLLMLGTNS